MNVRGVLEGWTRATHLGKGCARFVQPPSNLDDGTLSVISCSLHAGQARFVLTDWDNSLARPSVMTRKLVFLWSFPLSSLFSKW